MTAEAMKTSHFSEWAKASMRVAHGADARLRQSRTSLGAEPLGELGADRAEEEHEDGERKQEKAGFGDRWR